MVIAVQGERKPNPSSYHTRFLHPMNLLPLNVPRLLTLAEWPRLVVVRGVRWLAAMLMLAALPLTSLGEMIQVSISCSDHGDVSPKDTVTIPANTDLTITASPEAGYEVYDWFIDGNPGGWDVNQIVLHLGDLDVAVHVVFERITNLVHVTAGSQGRVSPGGNDSSVPVGWGDSPTFTATPDLHYHVATWTLNGAVVQSGGGTYVLSHVTEEHWIEVDFAPDVYTVQASAGPHGILSPTGAIQVVYGDSQDFTATPDRGQDMVVWSLDGKPVLTNATLLTLANVASNHVLQVSFNAPVLAIALTPTNSVLVSWPEALSSYALQETGNLSTPNWTNSVAPVTARAGRQQAVFPHPPGQRFFRLTQP